MIDMQRARQHTVRATGWYVGVDLLPYQAALGLSLRWFESRPHLRLYLGPLKLYAGLSRQPFQKG